MNYLIKKILILCLLIHFTGAVWSIPKYDEGRRVVNGIQLLQDSDEPLNYYYIPPYPRISTGSDGELDLLCLKFVGNGNQTNGGILHALIEFSLTPGELSDLQQQLENEIPGAQIIGPVQFVQALENGEDGIGNFKVVSSILNNTSGENPFTQTVIADDAAPLLPGSKSAVAARLNQEGATLLWESLTGPTSDISITIKGYYETQIEAFNATVSASVSSIYEHYSKLLNVQEEFTKDEIRSISDELIDNQVLKIDVFDRSQALGINTGNMETILNLVTDKLTELMFDSKTGWSKPVEKTTAIEKGQVKGRQSRGFLSKLFKGSGNQEYYTDNQFVIKKIDQIKTNTFFLNLSKRSTIKVPFQTSGNLGGIYDSLGSNPRNFRIVNLDDPDFQKREVHFQVDGKYVDSFNDLLNFVTVNFRKTSKSGPDITRNLLFKKSDIAEGQDLKTIIYPRLGESASTWLDYEYQISWSLKGNNQIIWQPVDNKEWIQGNASAITLIPPFKKTAVEIDLDQQLLQAKGLQSVYVRFFAILGGSPKVLGNMVLKSDDVESSRKIALYHDEKEPLGYQITWFSNEGKVALPIELLKSDYLFLIPPDENEFVKN